MRPEAEASGYLEARASNSKCKSKSQGLKPNFGFGSIARAKARAYLRSNDKNNDNRNDNRRFP